MTSAYLFIVGGNFLFVIGFMLASGDRSKSSIARQNKAFTLVGSIHQRIANVRQTLDGQRKKTPRDWLAIAICICGVVVSLVGVIYAW